MSFAQTQPKRRGPPAKKGFYRDGHGSIIVQYYNRDKGKQDKLPTGVTAHLKSLPDDKVTAWVEQWKQQYAASHKAAQKLLHETDEAQQLFTEFLAYYDKARGRLEETSEDDRGLWNNHIIRYFVEQRREKDLRNWRFLAGDFTMYLTTLKKPGRGKKNRMVGILNRFGLWLHQTKNFLAQPWHFDTIADQTSEETPLPRCIAPEEVLAYVRSVGDRRVKLLTLLGYFASLRPGETFGLTKVDFYTGPQAVALAATAAKFGEHKGVSTGKPLGSRLSLYVGKQNRRRKEADTPKTARSIDYVNIWDARAAQELAGLLNRTSGPLFEKYDPKTGVALEDRYARDSLFGVWSKSGGQKVSADPSKKGGLGVTLHDLRRASAVYLGMEVMVPGPLLKDHMRHTRFRTTELYLRRPKSEQAKVETQTFDHVDWAL